MPVLLFRLNSVPVDEADEVRALLSNHHIAFYETDAGRWGVSVAGIWLHDESQLEAARTLIDHYQIERTARVRQEYEAQRRTGEHDTLVRRLLRQPLAFVLYLLSALAILYLSLVPFVRWS